MNKVLLEVKDLETSLKIDKQWLATVENISFELSKGEVLGIVGESGCGKSILSKSIIKLLPEKISKLSKGEVIFDGKRIDKLKEKQLLNIRGNDIAMIFQEPMTALNPVCTIKNQLVESIKLHKKLSKKEAHKAAVDLLKKSWYLETRRNTEKLPSSTIWWYEAKGNDSYGYIVLSEIINC